jgi:hypothetical protein
VLPDESGFTHCQWSFFASHTLWNLVIDVEVLTAAIFALATVLGEDDIVSLGVTLVLRISKVVLIHMLASFAG